jgi:restriction system protein
MSIPDFQMIMLPLLKFASDGQEHSIKETIQNLGQEFKLTESELSELLPSGVQGIFYNRVYWAKAHLKMAGLLENTRRAHFRITNEGKEFLINHPSFINVKVLKSIPAYLTSSKNTKPDKSEDLELSTECENETEATLTPEENFEYFYQNIKKALAQELLSKIKSLSPSFFEKLVIDLLVHMGYGGSIKDAGKAVGRSGDEGIDGIIKEDKLGLDVIYIQAKRWEGVVGRPELQKFVGALAGQGARKGIFITTSSFTRDAKEFSPKNETKIVLIDGEQLAEYMIDYNVGVSTISTYKLKKIDGDYFEED